MDTVFTKIGAAVLFLIGVLHLVRLITRESFEVLVPLWTSVALATLLLYGFVQYGLSHDIVTSRVLGMVPYYFTMVLFGIGFVLHAYRIFLNQSVLAVLPLWWSFIGFVGAFMLSLYNALLKVD